jgi:hypothetical protein
LVFNSETHGGMGKTPDGGRAVRGCKFPVMKSAALPQNNNPARIQPSVPAASSNQTAIAAGPARAVAARSAWAFYLTQGASSVSMKLITERAGISAPVFHEIREERYEAYVHGGLND